MKSIIPSAVDYAIEKARFATVGLKNLYSGKVRETFSLPHYPDLLLFYATDRVSIFDIVLNALIPGKGYVLTAMAIMWFTQVFKDVPNHLVAYGKAIDGYLPEELRGDKDLQRRCMIVKKVHIFKVEAIARGNLTGSGYVDYVNSGKVCGHTLPPGLRDGDELPVPLFTPSTKAEQGSHDQNISFDEMVKIVGMKRAEKIRDLAISLFQRGKEFAAKDGIIIADTKFEMGISELGELVLADEVLTPDSSRIWLKTDWEIAQQKGVAPQGFDKQFIREWGKSVGIKKDPTQIPPQEVIVKTSKLYFKGADILLHKTIGDFWVEDMGIDA